jgi:farnesyl-diphosphate farnesyltransferase
VPPELTQLLRDTSRSFFLTVRVLPKAVRGQIGLAYLLARATDTVADTDVVPVAHRIEVLAAIRSRLLGESNFVPGLVEFASSSNSSATPAERQLLARLNVALRELDAVKTDDRDDIRWVLDIITRGQMLDLERFACAAPGRPLALGDDAALDDYTWRVAGCVGEFWSRLTRRHLFAGLKMDKAAFFSDGRRFGQGLQLVNILRDVPRDLRNGRCYFPEPALTAVGLAPRDLMDPSVEARFRPVYNLWVARAVAHLEAGWRHVNTLPAGAVRMRLAEAWPVLLGARTLRLLRTGPVLDPARRIKVSRDDVRDVMIESLLRIPFAGAWRRQFAASLQ